MIRGRFPFVRFTVIGVVAAVLAACAGSAPSTGPRSGQAAYVPRVLDFVSQPIVKPALLSIDYNTRALEYWPIQKGGSQKPVTIARNVANSGAMAADGNVVAITTATPSQVTLYDVQTRTKTTMPDPFGEAIDIAIGRDGSIYVLNLVPKQNDSTITVYPGGSPHPQEVTCSLLGFSGSIAVDDESNIFYNGYFRNNSQGVIEISHEARSSSCRVLDLNPETGYIGGVAIDPKTDALATLSEPDLCAGGYEAEMTVYPKPYSKSTAHVHEMAGNCTGGLRLSADSGTVFYGDQDVSGSYSFVREATFPDGRNFGAYGGGAPSGFTTIPNTLPN
ncbi:MAG TPA: hypothetical protein VGZ02_11985 [Candidatus Baltobacteraceae bacterium]|jgi:hypothetical protein|nr:hypothetical protein [Candidatus Baltobacteraceae bacterium]